MTPRAHTLAADLGARLRKRAGELLATAAPAEASPSASPSPTSPALDAGPRPCAADDGADGDDEEPEVREAGGRNDGVIVDVLRVALELAGEERLVLLVLARRLLAGQRAYGRLDLAHDTRDFRRERAEELADALVYTAVGEVARTMRMPRTST